MKTMEKILSISLGLMQIERKQILSTIGEIGLERLRPMKEALTEEIDYEDIKIVIIKNRLK